MTDSLTAFELLLDIDQRCRLLAADLPSQETRQQSWSGIGFRIGAHWYVAPMGEVSEVLHEPRYTLLPGVKTWVKGVANLRGRLLPVMDLCGFFGHELSARRKQRRVLVVEHRDVFAGLMVAALCPGQPGAVADGRPGWRHERVRQGAVPRGAVLAGVQPVRPGAVARFHECSPVKAGFA